MLGRELLLAPGQRWDELLADESVRNLQGMPPLFFANGERFGAPQVWSIVALVPVASPVPGTVDVLAVTRDVWSLRFNTNFEFQRDRLTLLETALSENNLFGWRKQLAARFEMDLGRFGIGPTYFDPNVAGTRLTCSRRAPPGTRAAGTVTRATTSCSRCATRCIRSRAAGAPASTSSTATRSSGASATMSCVRRTSPGRRSRSPTGAAS